MKSIQLSTRFRQGQFEGEAVLLVFDVAYIDGATIGDDVRDVLERRPYVQRIYVLAPYLNEQDVEDAIRDGTALRRAGAVGKHPAAELFVVGMRRDEAGLHTSAKSFKLQGDAALGGNWSRLETHLQEGWLFNLFDTSKGLVNAPIGVHFSKASGKHASKFLRTSCALLSSEACGALAFFALAKLPLDEPRRVFVDTAPLLSLAFSMQRVATIRGLWSGMPPARSFSSYGGVNDIPRFGRSDLVLISASTSGGLAARLVELGASKDRMLTLYVLKSKPDMKTDGLVLCDLTHVPERLFGYPLLDNEPAVSCKLCKQGYVLAELEGDQFLLEKRHVKRLRVGALSQVGNARATAELLCRHRAISVRLLKRDTRRTDISIDVANVMSRVPAWEQGFIRLVTRFVPAPLSWIVAVDVSSEYIAACFDKAGARDLFDAARVVDWSQLSSLSAIPGANALVVAPYLCDHATLRGINAQLRPLLDGGCVAYLAGVTIADSARNLSDLRIFLQYGEHGPETFIFRSALEFMLPWHGDAESSWAAELNLLLRIKGNGGIAPESQARLEFLQNSASTIDGLFLSGQVGQLAINPDFVLLDTKEKIDLISQADIYAVVSNCLAAVRSDNVALDAKVLREAPTPAWRQSVFAQCLLCPSNFRDFNDAVLRASLLRAAFTQELNYSVDEAASEEMLDVLRADIASWSSGKGDSLPEFLVALASRRLRLVPQHLGRVKALLEAVELPPHLAAIAGAIPVGP